MDPVEGPSEKPEEDTREYSSIQYSIMKIIRRMNFEIFEYVMLLIELVGYLVLTMR